jgi:L-ribulose-5-phosphate 4-epimerase
MPEYSLPEKLSFACRILAVEGHWDLDLGHMSARMPGKDQVLMKSMGLGLEEVTPENLVTIDLSGRKLSTSGSVHVEYPIHTEIYKAREDVGAVIHTHPPYATALASTGKPIVPMSHDALIFTKSLSVFTLTPELLTREDQGRELARSLSDGACLLIKNHGVVVVGKSVEEACIRAVLLEKAAHIQWIASQFKDSSPISPQMAEEMYKDKWSGFHVGHIWDYLVRKVSRTYPLYL